MMHFSSMQGKTTSMQGSPDPGVPLVRELLGRLSAVEEVAFVEGRSGRSLTWSQVAARAAAWKDARPELRPGRPLGLLVEDPVEMAAAYLCAVAAGLTVAPLDPSAPPADLAGRMLSLGIGTVVTDSSLQPSASSTDQEVGTAAGARAALVAGASVWSCADGELEILRKGRQDQPPAPPTSGAALVLGSSGTTGAPKIIGLSEAQLVETAAAVVSHHGLSALDCCYSPLPLFHINGLVVGVLSAVVAGSRLVVERRFSAARFWEVALEQGATWLNLVPAIIAVLAEGDPPAPEVTARAKFARSASAPLPAAVRERFERRTGITILETYGMTEAASQITANPCDPRKRRPGSVGRPVAVDLRVVGGDRRPLPPGLVGEVEIRGRRVIEHYLEPAGSSRARRPARHVDGWLATGDLGRLDEQGFLYLEGRRDDVINRGGEKVYPRRIEEVLLRDPDVHATAVVGRPHPVLGEEPVAFVEVAAHCRDHAALVARLQARCAEELARYCRPASITVASRLPAGPTGKVRRSELRRLVVAGAP